MKRIPFEIILIGVCAAACSPAAAATPAGITLTASLAHDTATPALAGTKNSAADTLSPTLSPTPSITFPVPTDSQPLQTDGPYLAYFRQLGDEWSLVLADADGKGKKRIPLPGNLYSDYQYSQQFSPDGRWFLLPLREYGTTTNGINYTESWYLLNLSSGEMEFLNHSSIIAGNYQTPGFSGDSQWLEKYSGLLPTPDEFDMQGDYGLSLIIIRLADGQILKELNLLPDGFPETIREQADKISSTDMDGGIRSLYATFFNGIGSRNWSPDNRYLAFSGAMDGPSSDVYLFDTKDLAVTRLTDGPENAQWMDWSPDGNRILHSSTLEYCEMVTCENYFVVPIDGGPAQPIPDVPLDHGGHFYQSGWLTPSKFVFFGLSNGGHTPLRYFDLDQKRTVVIFPDTSAGFGSIDYETHSLIAPNLGAMEFLFFNAVSGVKKPLPIDCDPGCGLAGQIDFGPYRFFASGDEATYLVDKNGSSIKVIDGSAQGWSSPDSRWIAFLQEDPFSISVYGSDLKLKNQFSPKAEHIWSIIWRPDSKGFFFQADSALEYFDLLTGQRQVIDDGLSSNYQMPYPITWVAE